MKTERTDLKSISKGGLRSPRLNNGLAWALVLAITAAGALGLGWPRPAAAKPTASVISGSTATFTGDENMGITNTALTGLVTDFSTPPITTVVIQNLTADISPSPPYLAGLYMQYIGAKGGKGKDKVWQADNGHAGVAGLGLTATYNGVGHTMLVASSPYGIYVNSSGGKGGNGGVGGGGFGPGLGGDGGNGGLGGSLTLNSSGLIQTPAGYGIYTLSKGGDGGTGGNGTSAISYGQGGHGGFGGAGSTVSVTNDGAIESGGSGIAALSFGGNGGGGGHGYGTAYGNGGNGRPGGNGGQVTVTNYGAIATQNQAAHGIDAESRGGAGGAGGWGGGTGGVAGVGGIGGSAQKVTVTNLGAITTQESEAYGILAMSLGGAGGEGGNAGGIYGKGGAALGSGPGGPVSVTNSGDIETHGDGSRGIFVESVGGFAGSGGSGGGIAAFGASGNSGGDGGNVDVTNTGNITTYGNAITTEDQKQDADALFVQSVGGGGGSGGGAGGLFSMGGSGDAGGNGGTVTVENHGLLDTSGDDGRGIFAQSVGGGGGNGGTAVTADLVSVSLGGDGGGGGNGAQVGVQNYGGVTTGGTSADGVFAQSLGGGGGKGGYAVSAAESGLAVSVALGGSGGNGGAGAEVSAFNDASILTSGKMSTGLTAQSVGGGGGDAGFSIAAASGAVSVGVALGGSGGGGGAGGPVTVRNYGVVSTQGELGHGLFAQSVGGGGGNGGFAVTGTVGFGSVGVGLGGSSGNGGGSGTVDLENYGNITTHGVGAYGILAQSLAGGGGVAGFATSVALSFGGSIEGIPIPSLSVGVDVGGKGGLGGDAQKVTVNNYANITTTGTPVVAATEGDDDVIPVDDSACYGILAQSVGGGGGDAGKAAAAALNFSKGAVSGSVAVAVGGSGGSGGNGGQVEVTNTGAINTLTDNSIGIFAQSVGGGGGNGGVSRATAGGFQVTTKPAYTLQASVSVGGSGGAGGKGDLVTVTDSGSVTTMGNNAIGILAQSVGGGGGNGGHSLAADFSRTQSLKGSDSIGGSGGVAGSGGDVNVRKNGGDLRTAGAFAPGILAQSIGGGGGNGGWSCDGTLGNFSIDATTKCNVSANESLGGSGGSGNTGGAVTVTNKGEIVNVKQYIPPANIFTQGDSSYGIFAQSVGGGGGNGGFSFNGTLSSTTGSDGKTWYGSGVNLQVGATIGGFGGLGADAGTVNVDNDGNITTAGYAAHGIFAQSIGGGGGVGGDSGMFNFMLPTKGTGEVPAGGWNLSVNVNVGGFGGDAGNGNNVTVTNVGNILTQGEDACGIFAQSVGGGGGTGGNAWRVPTPPLPIGGLDIKSFLKGLSSYNKWAVFVGGYGGAAGNGGDVVVKNYGAITTTGGVLPGLVNNSVHGAMGIFAQSVGGGGGTAGNANIGYKAANIGFGGAGGSSGDGGQVTVTNYYGADINTQGGASSGIFAQSVGGGGGIAGNTVRSLLNEDPDQIPYLHYVGLSTGFGIGGGDGGSGGQVTVNNYANITTQGTGAYGIFAQSVGGGGGTGGIDSGYPGKLIFDGSVWHGAPGDGGQVTVHQEDGTITTNGDYTPGIMAQSTSGSGKAGTVGVSLVGSNVYANGIGSNGIQAQSLGAGSSSNISVSLDSASTVQGGSPGTILNSDGSTTPCDAYGVLFMDGAANVLNNHGFITTASGKITDASGVNGTAVAQQADYGAPKWGNLTINNSGIICGSINQVTQVLTDDSKQLAAGLSLPAGSSTITFNNYPGAFFDTGSIINLGSGTLTNSGYLVLKGGGIGQVNLTGNFAQNETGTFLTVLNGDGTCGSLKVSGTATLAGTLRGQQGSGVFTNGTKYTILQSSNPITTKFTTEDLPHTDLLSFSTNYLTNAVQVVSSVNSFATVARDPLAMELAQHLDTLVSAHPSLLSGAFIRALREFQTTDRSNYQRIFESLSPGIYDADTITTFSITRQYVRTLQQRLQLVRDNLRSSEVKSQAQASQPVLLAFNGSNQQLGQFLTNREEAALYRRLGVWLQGFGQWGSQDMVNGFSGFDYSLAGTAAGLDYALTKRLVVGANFGYGYTNLDQDNSFASGNINSLYGSLYGTYFGERAYLEGVLSYGHHKYNNQRLISIGPLQRVAESDHTGNSFFLFMEGGYTWPVQNWNLQPYASVFYTYLDEGSFQESGARGLDMQVDARQTNSVVSEMGLRLARPIKTSKGTLTPEVKVAWQHDFAVSDRTLPISFAGAPLGFSVNGRDLGQDSAVVSAGLTLTSLGGVTTMVKYDGEIRGDYRAHAVIGEIRLPF
jgi:uncharacterized protein YhjY with autotransporter beta-barrel domain